MTEIRGLTTTIPCPVPCDSTSRMVVREKRKKETYHLQCPRCKRTLPLPEMYNLILTDQPSLFDLMEMRDAKASLRP